MSDGQQHTHKHDERPVPGVCGFEGCDHPRIWPSNGICPVHNKLIKDFRIWLGFLDGKDPRLGSLSIDADTDLIACGPGEFDRYRVAIQVEPRNRR